MPYFNAAGIMHWFGTLPADCFWCYIIFLMSAYTGTPAQTPCSSLDKVLTQGSGLTEEPESAHCKKGKRFVRIFCWYKAHTDYPILIQLLGNIRVSHNGGRMPPNYVKI